MDDALISVVTGLVGTLVGAAIAWLAGNRSHRLETAHDMHREFHSPEMTHSRNLGGALVRKHSSKTYDEMRRMLSPEDTQHIWNVMYFYQRLSLAIKNASIHKKYVGEMFGENFIWWYLKSYDKQLVNIKIDEDLRWQASRDIAWLQKWLDQNTDRKQFDQWVRRANKMQDPIAPSAPQTDVRGP
jgi:hypothetical protein